MKVKELVASRPAIDQIITSNTGSNLTQLPDRPTQMQSRVGRLSQVAGISQAKHDSERHLYSATLREG